MSWLRAPRGAPHRRAAAGPVRQPPIELALTARSGKARSARGARAGGGRRSWKSSLRGRTAQHRGPPHDRLDRSRPGRPSPGSPPRRGRPSFGLRHGNVPTASRRSLQSGHAPGALLPDISADPACRHPHCKVCGSAFSSRGLVNGREQGQPLRGHLVGSPISHFGSLVMRELITGTRTGR